jgi:hypothetical protein
MARHAVLIGSLLLGVSACGAAKQQQAPREANEARAVAPAPAPASTTPVSVTPSPAASPSNETFEGWFVNGTNAENFRVVHDRDVKQAGSASARLECVAPKDDAFGGIMQSIAPDSLRGKRVRFSALVRTRDVAGWVGLWMRVDRPSERSSAFDNMGDRSIKGNTDWTRYSVVLDVAADASNLSYGLLLADGAGTAWLDDAAVEIVD